MKFGIENLQVMSLGQSKSLECR